MYVRAFQFVPTPGFFLSTLFLGPKRDVIGNLLGLSCPLGKSIDPMVTRRFSSMGKLSFEFNTLVISDMWRLHSKFPRIIAVQWGFFNSDDSGPLFPDPHRDPWLEKTGRQTCHAIYFVYLLVYPHAIVRWILPWKLCRGLNFYKRSSVSSKWNRVLNKIY